MNRAFHSLRSFLSLAAALLAPLLSAELERVQPEQFLPQVSATAGYTWHAKEPMMQEKRAASGTLDAGLPVFMPSSWFLYSLAKHGQASADTAAAYVRQSIVLQTTADYFDVLVQQETVSALAAQAAAAREYAARVEGLAAEGFYQDWERDQAVYLAEARESELNRAHRHLDIVRGNLVIQRSGSTVWNWNGPAA